MLAICAVNKCLDPRSLSKLHDWYKRTDLPFFTTYSQDIVSKNNVLSAMDAVCGVQNGEEFDLTLNIEKALFENSKSKLPKKFLDGLLYDLTANIYHGTKCLLAEVGHKTVGNNKTQINVALVLSRYHNIPLFHMVFKGSVRDVKTIGNLLHVLNKFGIKDTILIWDRGNTSNDTIEWAEQQGLHLIVGLRKDILEVKKLFKEFPIEERYDTLIRDKMRTKRNDKIKTAFDKLEQLSKKNLTKEEFERRIKKILSGVKEYIWTHLTPKGDGHYALEHGVQEFSLEQAAFADGKFALLSTNTSLTAEETVNSYFGKNDIEMAFRIMKHVIDMSTVKHTLNHRVKCYILICFLSYYLFSYLNYKLKEAGITESVEQILEQLNEIEKTELKYGNQKQTRYLNLGSSQKEIIKKLDFSSLYPQKVTDRTNL